MAVTKTINPSNQNTGASGTILQGQGLGTADAHSTATYPSVGTSTGSLLRADGTNWSATTTTYPNTNAVSTLLYASSANVMGALTTANNGTLVTSSTGVPSILAGGTAGQVLQSVTSAAPAWSTPTYPSASGSAGQILRSDGTNNVYTTNTYPNTATTGDILIATGTSVIGSLADVAVHQVLTSGGVGVAPAYSAYPQVSGLGVGASAGSTAGITFDGSNWLNNYATGSWTPTIDGSVSGTTTYAGSGQVGIYTRIGNVVYCIMYISITAATGTGNAIIGGLPFTAQNTTNADSTQGVYINGSTFTWPASTTEALISILPNTTTANILCNGNGVSGVQLQMSNHACVFRCGFFYLL